jgi:hypothetical protein
MFRHHHIPMHRTTMPHPHRLQCIKKDIARLHATQMRPPPIATESDKMKIPCLLITSKSPRHKAQATSPRRPRLASRTWGTHICPSATNPLPISEQNETRTLLGSEQARKASEQNRVMRVLHQSGCPRYAKLTWVCSHRQNQCRPRFQGRNKSSCGSRVPQVRVANLGLSPNDSPQTRHEQPSNRRY